MVGEIPVYIPPENQRTSRGRHNQKTPQKKIDDFWKKFTTKAPGKGKCLENVSGD